MIQPQVLQGVFTENYRGKKILSRGEYCPHTYKIIYDLIIAITNKYFEFQNDWFKLICDACTMYKL